MIFFDRKNETMPQGQRDQVQLERLQAMIARLKRNVRRYREAIGDLRVESLDDVKALPVTTPEDLVAGIPYGLFALPLREVTRLHSTIGPGGKQLVIGYTRNDLTNWARLVARQLVAAGVTAHDVIQIRFDSGDVFEKSLGYMLGAEMIEASVIPEDPFHTEYQLAMLQNYRATVLITTPQNARDIIELLEQKKLDPQSLHLRTILLSRPISTEERAQLQCNLFAVGHCNFGVTEIIDPGFCVECEDGRLHVNEDHFLVETRDGELLVTTLCREAMPLLRYTTRIAAELSHEKCPCGRTGAILKPGKRLDDRMLVNETPLYRSQIEAFLEQTSAKNRSFKLEITDRKVIVKLAMNDQLFSDTMRGIVDVKGDLQSQFLLHFGIEADIHYVDSL